MVCSRKAAWLKEGVTMEIRGAEESRLLMVIRTRPPRCGKELSAAWGMDPIWRGVTGSYFPLRCPTLLNQDATPDRHGPRTFPPLAKTWLGVAALFRCRRLDRPLVEPNEPGFPACQLSFV